MKRKLWIAVFFVSVVNATAQSTFNWTDKAFHPGQTQAVQLWLDYDGSCSVIPCYDYSENKQTYDTIISFLNTHQDFILLFQVYSGNTGSAALNLSRSRKVGNGIIRELSLRGVDAQQIRAEVIDESATEVQPEASKDRASAPLAPKDMRIAVKILASE